MPTTDLKIRKVKAFNPHLKKHGYTTRAIINGTETFDSVAEEASRNTTINKYELAAALGIAAEQFARALKNGYAVDLGPIGKIYPTVTSKWTETPEEQTKSLLTKGLRYDASTDLKAAVEAMRLSWEKAKDEEEIEEEVVVDGDEEGDEHEGMFKAQYVVNGEVVAEQWYNPGDRVVEPEGLLPDGWIWGNTPSVMPERDVIITAVEDE